MRQIILTLLMVPVIGFLKAQNPIVANGTLVSATIYRGGAELNHIASASIPLGNSQLIFGNIANTIDENSIQLKVPTGVTVLSTTFSKDYQKNETKSPAYLKVEDSLNVARKELTGIQNKKNVNEKLLELLDKNQAVGGANTGVTVAELMKIMEYYKAKQLELRSAINELMLAEAAQQRKVNRLFQQLNEISGDKSGSKGQLVLQIIATEAVNANFNLSYLSPSASWTPQYDLRGENLISPLKIVYKANVIQSTGIDWKKIKLSLSTGTPTQTGTAPLLSAWFLRYGSEYDVLKALNGRVAGMSVTSNIVQSVDKKEYLKEKAAVDVVNVPDQNLAIQNSNTLNTSFEIDIPYDIASNNKSHSVILNTYNQPVNYKYYSVPKLENEVFLLAEITNYEKLNLLPGDANIIFENTYVGKSFLNPNATTDTLNLSMGRDKRIVVKREKVAEQSAAKVIGSSKKQTFTYEITLRNGKKETANLLLKDQFPVSTDKTIEVELLQSDGAVINAETGVLTWKLILQPGVTQKVRVSYSVKYPKDQHLANL